MTNRRSRERLLLVAAMIAIAAGGRAWSQDPARLAAPTPAPAQDPAARADDPAPMPVGDISARYRIQERFAGRDEKPPRGSIGQFQVGFREVISTDDPDNPEPHTVQAIFTELPVEVSPVDERVVTDSIRHYSSVTITPDPWKDRKDARPLKDLTVWLRVVPEDVPLVMVLTPNRTLREEEYRFAISYDFASNLAFLLPEIPLRIGDSWKVARTGASALINDEVRGGNLTGKLSEIRAHPSGNGVQLAIVQISGRLVTGFDRDVYDTAVNARVEFAFTPEREDEGRIDATGAIEKLRLVQVSTLRVPAGVKGRTTKRDLNYECKRPGTGAPLVVPRPAPTATPENSWLTYSDREARFHFNHPQGYRPFLSAKQPNTVELKYFRSGAPPEILRMTYVEKPEGRPEASFDLIVEDWKKKGYDVQRGLSERLPAADWPDMSVTHMEAALTITPTPGRVERMFFDAYVVQFPRNPTLFVSATTFQDNPEAFRTQVRAILKTAKLGSPKGR